MRLLLSKLFLIKLGILLCVPTGIASPALSQTTTEPVRSELLNGLRVALLSRPEEPDVLVKLRIHSGSAFDLEGKAGAAALLGDILFPDPTTREFFTEDMQGRLNVSTDYDTITITMQGRAREFERMIEILRTAVVTPQLTPANFSKVRDGRVKVLRETAISPGMLADRAIAARLFGDFPYGRPSSGAIESLERVQHTDLMLIRDRFLNPNNATLAIVGGVQPSRAMRALRQLLGGWRKSEQIVPTTFRQAAAPDPRILIISSPADQSLEVRLAVRGLARKDPDSVAVALLAKVMRERWEKSLPELTRSPVFVRHDALTLPGMLVMGATAEHLLAGKVLGSAQEVMKSLVASQVSAAELDQAKIETLTAWNKDRASRDGMINAWLDSDTYGVSSAAEQMRIMNAITPADLQRVASRLFYSAPVALVVVGNAELAKASVERYGKVELLGEVGARETTTPSPSTTQPQTKAKPE
jgi:zinc protease